jgi:hypothetical protein
VVSSAGVDRSEIDVSSASSAVKRRSSPGGSALPVGCDPQFLQIELALDARQHLVVDHALIA